MFTCGYVLDCTDSVGAIVMPGRMLSFAACAFVSFAIALGGEVMFAAFAAYLMETSALSGVMSELLTFVALDQLELGGILLWKESLMVDVNSMFDAFVGHL